MDQCIMAASRWKRIMGKNMCISEDWWGLQNRKLKWFWLKDYFLLGYPPFPFFFLVIWKGKESSLHPLRSLPDPFVNLWGLVTNSLLPAWMPPINAGDKQWTCVHVGSNPAATTHPLNWHPAIANPRQGLSAICAWTYRLTSPHSHQALEKKCHFVFKSFQRPGLLSQLLYFEQQGDVWEKEEARSPKQLFTVPDSISCSPEGKNEAKKNRWLKNMKKANCHLLYHYLV